MNELFSQVVGNAAAATLMLALFGFVWWLIGSFVHDPARHGAVDDKDMR